MRPLASQKLIISNQNKLEINKGKERHPCQTKRDESSGDRIRSPESLVTPHRRTEIQEAENQPQISRSDPKHERVENQAQGDLSNVQGQCVGWAAESALGPHEPGREAHQETRAH